MSERLGGTLPFHENFHQTNTAAAAGTANVTSKIGNSSATEYPSRETPIHTLINAATSQNARKICAVVTMDRPPPNFDPKSVRPPSSVKPPRMMSAVRIRHTITQ